MHDIRFNDIRALSDVSTMNQCSSLVSYGAPLSEIASELQYMSKLSRQSLTEVSSWEGVVHCAHKQHPHPHPLLGTWHLAALGVRYQNQDELHMHKISCRTLLFGVGFVLQLVFRPSTTPVSLSSSICNNRSCPRDNIVSPAQGTCNYFPCFLVSVAIRRFYWL